LLRRVTKRLVLVDAGQLAETTRAGSGRSTTLYIELLTAASMGTILDVQFVSSFDVATD
jgi:hypothetical protein